MKLLVILLVPILLMISPAMTSAQSLRLPTNAEKKVVYTSKVVIPSKTKAELYNTVTAKMQGNSSVEHEKITLRHQIGILVDMNRNSNLYMDCELDILFNDNVITLLVKDITIGNYGQDSISSTPIEAYVKPTKDKAQLEHYNAVQKEVHYHGNNIISQYRQHLLKLNGK